MSSSSPSTRRAFTLVELLVVIAIIGVLVALLLPAVQAAREAARRMQCEKNLKMIALAVSTYETAHKRFPAGRLGCDGQSSVTAYAQWCGSDVYPAGMSGTSTLVAILPYMEMQSLFDLFDLSVGPWSSNIPGAWTPANLNAVAQRPSAYVCPSDDSEPFTKEFSHHTGDWPVATSPSSPMRSIWPCIEGSRKLPMEQFSTSTIRAHFKTKLAGIGSLGMSVPARRERPSSQPSGAPLRYALATPADAV